MLDEFGIATFGRKSPKEDLSDRYGVAIYTGYPVGTQVNEARSPVKPV